MKLTKEYLNKKVKKEFGRQLNEKVSGDAQVSGNAKIYGHAQVFDDEIYDIISK